jgi:DNA mismatch endonuclease (patch repair protein)
VADVFGRAKRSRVMAAIRSVGNRTTERALAAAFRRLGLKGWRRHVSLPGKPDFVFLKARLAVFVDGCFWHGCPKHGHWPKTNRRYWRRKLRRNAERDRAMTRELVRRGWRVVRVWEHDVKRMPAVCAAKVAKALFRDKLSGSRASRSSSPVSVQREAASPRD